MLDTEQLAIEDRLEVAKSHWEHPVVRSVLLDAWELLSEVERLRTERNEARRCACRLLWERDEARAIAEPEIQRRKRIEQNAAGLRTSLRRSTYDPREVASMGYEVERGEDDD